MKRIFSMFLCLLMVFMLISSLGTCFAVQNIGIEYTDSTTGGSATFKIGELADDNTIKDTNTFDWNNIFTRYKNVIIGISGVAALSFLVFFIINFMKLGQSSGNPQMRSQALMGIVWCGIACAGLGGISIFFGFFYNALV